MNDYEIMDVLNKMERAMEFVKGRKDVDETLDRILKIQSFLERFSTLEDLIDHMKTMEKYFYLEKDLFTVEEAARYMGISKSLVYRLSSNREIPTYKPSGKLVYFAKNDLIQWMMQNVQVSEEQIIELSSQKLQELTAQRIRKRRKK